MSSPSSPALPPKGSIITSIRTSCSETRVSANIQVDEESIKTLLQSRIFKSTFKHLRLAHGLAMPLQFPSITSEVNLISLLSILNFAHGYRVPLKKATGRGAYDTIRVLLFGMYLSHDDEGLMSAKGLKNISKAKVAELMNLTNYIHLERPHPSIPGLTIGELGGPLYELVDLVTGVLNQTGEILVNAGYSDLGEFVIAALRKGQKDEQPGVSDAEVVLDEIIRTFPAFQDVGTFEGKPIYIFKKALFLLHALVLRFGQEGDRRIPLPDTDELPIFSDNVIPSMLVHFGVLDLSATTVPTLRDAFQPVAVTANLDYDPTTSKGSDEIKGKEEGSKGSDGYQQMAVGPQLSEQEAYVLRAAAIDACEMIVRMAKVLDVTGEDVWIQSLTLPELDGWLWSVAKEGRLRRDLSRFRQGGRCVMY
ncbi:hypothetical protein FRC18_007465 [Serendipita sp. 400]|nr:hypothetical protein FRC18_007465 [Serendipita sp. 400]